MENIKTYGCCPICGYELTLENSNYVASFQDLESNEHAIRENLMRYHFEASPDCKVLKKVELMNEWQKIQAEHRLYK